jgi:hypothetical protein
MCHGGFRRGKPCGHALIYFFVNILSFWNNDLISNIDFCFRAITSLGEGLGVLDIARALELYWAGLELE